MPLGVPDAEVFAAADAVLARGERPTVERVRAELGRGSPARVGKLLESWWDALARRHAGETRLPDLPAEVASAFSAVWAEACRTASLAAEAKIAAERAALDTERRELLAAQETAQAAVDVARSETASARAALATAEARVAADEERIREQVQQIEALRDEGQAARAREAVLRNERDAAIDALAKAEAARELEREQHAAHTRATEDRAHAEVDRAREESRRTEKRLVDAERAAAAAADASRQRIEHLQAANQAGQRELAAASARIAALETQLSRMDGLPAALLAAQQALNENGQRLFELQRLIGERHRTGAGESQPGTQKKNRAPRRASPDRS
jgi:chromosome segregation ATPase